MFTVIRNYRTLLLGFIRSEFGRHMESGGYQEQQIVSDSNSSDLDENVQELIKDGKIDEKDLKTLKSIESDMTSLEKETQDSLKDYLKNMINSTFVNGFKINGQDGFDALKRIAELTGNTELIDDLKGLNVSDLDGKSIARIDEENKILNKFKGFDVYDSDGDRIGYLDKGTIKNYDQNLFFNDNVLENDNRTNVKTSDVDKGIDDILKKNIPLKEKRENSEKIQKLLDTPLNGLNKIQLQNLDNDLYSILNNRVGNKLRSKIESKISLVNGKIADIENKERNNQQQTTKATITSNPHLATVNPKVNPTATTTSPKENFSNINKIHDIVTPMKIDGYTIYEESGVVHLVSIDKKHNAYFTINNPENSKFNNGESIKAWAKKFTDKWEKTDGGNKINKKEESKDGLEIPGDSKINIPENLAELVLKGETVPVGKYTDDLGKSRDILLKVTGGKYMVELDRSRIFDLDTTFKMDGVKDTEFISKLKTNIQEKIKVVIKEYKKDDLSKNNEYVLNKEFELSAKEIKELGEIGIDLEEIIDNKDKSKSYRLDRSGLWSNDFTISKVKGKLVLKDDNKKVELEGLTNNTINEALTKSDEYLKLLNEAENKIDNNENKNSYLEKEDLSELSNYLEENTSKTIIDLDKIKKVIDKLGGKEGLLLSEDEKTELKLYYDLGFSKEDIDGFAKLLGESGENSGMTTIKSFPEGGPVVELDRANGYSNNLYLGKLGKKETGFKIVDDNSEHIDISNIQKANVESVLKNADTYLDAIDSVANPGADGFKEGSKEAKLEKYLNSLSQITDTKKLGDIIKVINDIKNEKNTDKLDGLIEENNESKKQKEFDAEIKERGLEGLGLSMKDMQILSKADGVEIDLSDIEKQEDGSYKIDINGSDNLIITHIKDDNGKGYKYTGTESKFKLLDYTSINIRDAIINGTKDLLKYDKENTTTNYDPTKVTRKR